MNSLNLLAAAAEATLITILICLITLCWIVVLVTFFKRYTKVGPDELLVLSGRKYQFRDQEGKTHTSGTKIVRGGGVLVWPLIEEAKRLSLKPLAVDLALPKVAL